MKKMFFVALTIAALTLAACGGKKKNPTTGPGTGSAMTEPAGSGSAAPAGDGSAAAPAEGGGGGGM